MRILVVDDDNTCRLIMIAFVEKHGAVSVATNGKEALTIVATALMEGVPFDLICLDVMMPEMDGHAVLKGIRALEACYGIKELSGSKIVMTTALDDFKNVSASYNNLCNGYLVKPIRKERVKEELIALKLIAP